MMLLNITKNIIKIGMILTSISILGCCKSKSQHILLPIDNVIYFMLDVNNDTTTIIEKKGLYSREVLKYYRDHDNVFTSDYGGDKELLMSVTQLSDSIYTGGRFRRHRIHENKNRWCFCHFSNTVCTALEKLLYAAMTFSTLLAAAKSAI